MVAPFVGAWIEIPAHSLRWPRRQRSLPSWGRGLKSDSVVVAAYGTGVAPFVGAWIEMLALILEIVACVVSLPSWGRGLKWR